eukprot:1919144-Ditylum_brightwellii.AAC.1
MLTRIVFHEQYVRNVHIYRPVWNVSAVQWAYTKDTDPIIIHANLSSHPFPRTSFICSSVVIVQSINNASDGMDLPPFSSHEGHT